MLNIKVKFTGTDEEQTYAFLPARSYKGDLGFDLTLSEEVIIPPHETALAHTNIAMEFPVGWGGLVRDRSSGPHKYGIAVVAGVVDNGYRGEILIDLLNFSDAWVYLNPGTRIAQIVPIPVFDGDIVPVAELSPSDRGDKGHGSTGA